jgi:pimeloyl-ACP methyl ester carboxylesterase
MSYISIGTTANVRDIVTMADAIYGSDKDINFYGVSYGTYMGMILTQLYPNRIGKVILDGIFLVFVDCTSLILVEIIRSDQSSSQLAIYWYPWH